MSDELNENLDSEIQATEEVVNTEEVEDTVADTGSEDKAKLEELNKKLFERAKKAEAELKEFKAKAKTETKAEVTAEKQADVSVKDQYALLQAQVPADDIDEVLAYAKFKGISVAEALKTTVVKATLAERAEQRKTAQVANTSASKRTTARQTDEQILEKGYEADNPEALAEARHNLKRKK